MSSTEGNTELSKQNERLRGRISALLGALYALGTSVNGRRCFCHPTSPDSRTPEGKEFIHSESCERAWGVLQEEAIPDGSLDEIILTAEEEARFTPEYMERVTNDVMYRLRHQLGKDPPGA